MFPTTFLVRCHSPIRGPAHVYTRATSSLVVRQIIFYNVTLSCYYYFIGIVQYRVPAMTFKVLKLCNFTICFETIFFRKKKSKKKSPRTRVSQRATQQLFLLSYKNKNILLLFIWILLFHRTRCVSAGRRLKTIIIVYEMEIYLKIRFYDAITAAAFKVDGGGNR